MKDHLVVLKNRPIFLQDQTKLGELSNNTKKCEKSQVTNDHKQ